MTRPNRRVAGHPFPGRTELAAALARVELTEQAWRNFIALRRFSGDAWTDRYREHARRRLESPTVPIPAQRRPHQDKWDRFVTSAFAAARYDKPLYGAAAEASRRRRGQHGVA